MSVAKIPSASAFVPPKAAATAAACPQPSPVALAVKNALPSAVLDVLQAIIVEYQEERVTEERKREIQALVRLPIAAFTPNENVLQFERALATTAPERAESYRAVVEMHHTLFGWSNCEAFCQRYCPTPPAAMGLCSLVEESMDCLADLLSHTTCDESTEERSPTPIPPFVAAATSMSTLMEQNEALLAELFEIVEAYSGVSADAIAQLESVGEWCKRGVSFSQSAAATIAEFSANNRSRIEAFQDYRRTLSVWPHSAAAGQTAKAADFTFEPTPFNPGQSSCTACKVGVLGWHAWQDPAKMHDPTRHK